MTPPMVWLASAWTHVPRVGPRDWAERFSCWRCRSAERIEGPVVCADQQRAVGCECRIAVELAAGVEVEQRAAACVEAEDVPGAAGGGRGSAVLDGRRGPPLGG